MFILRVLLAIGTLVCVKTAWGGALPENTEKKLSIYIDAGSTGTRLGLYSCERDLNAEPIVTELGSISTRSGQGLHEFLPRLEAISDYLEPLLSFAEKKIGTAQMKEVPIFLYATGGMRTLSKIDQDKIYAEVLSYLQGTRKLKNVFVKSIEGNEEGLFAWLTVNYHLGNLKESRSSVGVIDMGGETLQIAFELSDRDKRDYRHVMNITLGGKSRRIYSYSYKGFGQNTLATENQMIQQLCFDHHHVSSRYKRCVRLIQEKIKKTCNDPNYCGLGSIPQPRLTGRFVGMGGFIYVAKDLELPRYSYQDLMNKSAYVCGMSKEQLYQKLTSNYVDKKDAICFRLSYYFALLYGKKGGRGLGFSKEDAVELLDTDIAHKSVNWLVGAAYYNSSKLFSQ